MELAVKLKESTHHSTGFFSFFSFSLCVFCLGPDFLESQSGLERQIFILLTNVYLQILKISVQK